MVPRDTAHVNRLKKASSIHYTQNPSCSIFSRDNARMHRPPLAWPARTSSIGSAADVPPLLEQLKRLCKIVRSPEGRATPSGECILPTPMWFSSIPLESRPVCGLPAEEAVEQPLVCASTFSRAKRIRESRRLALMSATALVSTSWSSAGFARQWLTDEVERGRARRRLEAGGEPLRDLEARRGADGRCRPPGIEPVKCTRGALKLVDDVGVGDGQPGGGNLKSGSERAQRSRQSAASPRGRPTADRRKSVGACPTKAMHPKRNHKSVVVRAFWSRLRVNPDGQRRRRGLEQGMDAKLGRTHRPLNPFESMRGRRPKCPSPCRP